MSTNSTTSACTYLYGHISRAFLADDKPTRNAQLYQAWIRPSLTTVIVRVKVTITTTTMTTAQLERRGWDEKKEKVRAKFGGRSPPV